MNLVPAYNRNGENEIFCRIGQGSLGGKASGLFNMQQILRENFPQQQYQGITVNIPFSVVIATDVFSRFMEQNELFDFVRADLSDTAIALKFQKAFLPAEITGDLYALAQTKTVPLAIRSSGLLEDAKNEPFAGVYATKMIPNNLLSPTARYQKLTEAIKFVYASVYFKEAKAYFKALKKDINQEKMAVLIQDIAGSKHGEYFYPALAGVAKSYNFYPCGYAKPEDGSASLALGLGKSVVDGGKVWVYSPRYPAVPPPYNAKDYERYTQTDFWAVYLGKIKNYNPLEETEYLEYLPWQRALQDEILPYLATTNPPVYTREEKLKATWFLDFAPLLKYGEPPLNNLLKRLLEICAKAYDNPVEIEFALDFPQAAAPGFSFLQVRPMQVNHEEVNLSCYEKRELLLEADLTTGNGKREIEQVVFVDRKTFKAEHTPFIAEELAFVNSRAEDYLLIVFGRLGSSDPWLGIPVTYSDISRAKAIVETTLPGMNPDLSQGSHFFHNITSLGVLFLSLRETFTQKLDWDWLEAQSVVFRSEHVCQVKLAKSLTVLVDGKSQKGVILK